MSRRDFEKEIARYELRAESGKRATVVEYQTIIETEYLDGTISQIGGARSYSGNTGKTIHRIDNGSFLIDDEIYRDENEAGFED